MCVAAAFVSYCGPFNTEYREKLSKDLFLKQCHSIGLPTSTTINITNFLVDQVIMMIFYFSMISFYTFPLLKATIGEWNLEGLPTDDLSIQNGIMVTTSSRYPLMIDPQSQGIYLV